MARNNVQTTVTVGMDVKLAKRNAEALKSIIESLKVELKEARAIMDNPSSSKAFEDASAKVDQLILKIKTLQKVQKSATPAAAYEAFISGDAMNSNTLRQAQRGAKNRLNTVQYGSGDTEARQFINDINTTQKQLNRLQAGFTSPFRTIKQELNKLSGGELQRLLQLLQQELVLVQGNEKAWANYQVAIAKVEQRIREYDTAARQAAGAQTLAKSQSGGFAQANERDINRAIEKLKEYRAVINDPNGTGMATWEATTREIQKLQASLDALKQRTKEMTGEAMSLPNAFQLGLRTLNGTFKGTTQQLELAKKTLESNLQTMTKGKDAYNHIRRALNGINLELQRTGPLTKEVQGVLDSPKGKSFNELKMAVEQGRAKLANMRIETDKDKKAFDELAAKVKEADIQMKTLASTSKGTASAFEKAWSRLKTYVGLYVGAAVAMQKLTATLGDLMDLSDKMGEVRKTTNFTADEVGRLSENLKKMDTRTALNGLLDLSVAAGQLGLKTEEDVLGFTEAANKLMVALPEMGKEGATEMLKVALATGEIDKIRKQMDQGLIEGSSATAVAMEKVGSTIDRLRATSAATAPAITDFVKRVGAVGAQSGITIDQVAALGSTVDALGMRVEMSATALSRMIPAIRSNAFDVAKAIGVTPDTLRNLFDTGRGMEAILMVFQHIRDSGMDEDSIESMLGMGNMKEVMKELNQMGARAGIVFAGLSQNVDELRRQLGVASQAYEENIAIEQEYLKMNETTAARWERLKNQVEEFFVGDRTQRWLGGIIDALRGIVDLLTGDSGISVTLRAILTYLGLVKLQLVSLVGGALKSLGSGLKNIGVMLGFIKGEMTKMQWGNVFTAAAGAVLYLYMALKELANAVSTAKAALGEANAETEKAIMRFEGYYTALKDTSRALVQAQKEHALLSAEVDRLRKSTDSSAQATANLKDKEDKLEQSEKNVTKAKNDHRSAIANMNSIYGQYLGFMLTEYDHAELVAAAHDKITAAIRREMLVKQQQAALNKISDKYTEDLATDMGALSEELTKQGRLNVQQAAQAKRDLQKFMREQVKYNVQKGQYESDHSVFEQMRKNGYDISKATPEEVVALWFNDYLEKNFHLDATARTHITGVNTDHDRYELEGGWQNAYTFHKNLRGDYAGTYMEYMKDQAEVSDLFVGELQDAVEQDEKSTKKIVEELKLKATKAQEKIANAKKGENVNKAYEDLAMALEGLDRNIGQLDPTKNAALIKSITEQAEGMTKNVNADMLTAARTRANSLFARATGKAIVGNSGFGGTGDKSTNVWGSNAPADSTDYSLFDVNELVARRNQMDKFKNVLKEDTNFEEVLKEDKALMKAINSGFIKANREEIINWYNTERKKIEQELHSERFSTNEGHWIADKKTGRKKNMMPETDYALAELDRYYSRRKEALEKARAEENISEELFNRQAELLEQEHLERRSKLRGTFTGELGKEETRQFRQWWDALEKEFELDHVKWETVTNEWTKATNAQIGRNNLKMQQDMTQMRSITVKHLNAIAKIIEKERPYDGIVANLRKNLTEMDILLADVQKDGPSKDTAALVQEQTRRLQFLLGEAETAYSSTIDDVLRRMGEQGMIAWADEIRKSDAMKNALMAQLQTAYDAVQDAIKKEASQIKKQTDIWWNDLVPGQGTSRKGGFEKVLSQLGLQEDQVKRANALIGAGQASERVADKLAIKQMELRLQMQQVYYNRMRQIWNERIASLRAQGKEIDAQHAEISKQLSLSEEQKKLDEQRVAIANQLEESQNRLYKELKEYGDLLASSLQSVVEASHTGDAEFYNERAKLDLTGKGGPGAGTYVVIDNAGTSDAEAHYEYLSEREALEREHEIERENAMAEAWKKVADDINAKMNESITDWMNAFLQNQSLDANTIALEANTQALVGLTAAEQGQGSIGGDGTASTAAGLNSAEVQEWTEGLGENPMLFWPEQSDIATEKMLGNMNALRKGQDDTGKRMAASAQSTFAKMTVAANLYGAAYQAMSNDNLSTAQKFEMFALQSAGQSAIAMLTTDLAKGEAENTVRMPGILGKLLGEMPYPAAIATFAVITALMGGLMGLAISKVAKSKSQIAQATGASGASAGKLTTGMLTYATGNVNEFTDPSALTPGRQYNVDAADGRTYRARYMGKGAKTHITNGPEFHLVGEQGREAIIDAKTTRNIRMNEPEIWRSIQTLYNGGSLSHAPRRRGRGMAAYADGNLEEMGIVGADSQDGGIDMAVMQASLDRNSAATEALLERLQMPIKAVVSTHGPDGIVAGYDRGKKEAMRHGVNYS